MELVPSEANPPRNSPATNTKRLSRIGTVSLQPQESHEQEHRRKVVLLTGTSGGLRKCAAYYFARLGATVGRKVDPHRGREFS
jgi:hypothetical protein